MTSRAKKTPVRQEVFEPARAWANFESMLREVLKHSRFELEQHPYWPMTKGKKSVERQRQHDLGIILSKEKFAPPLRGEARIRKMMELTEKTKRNGE